MQVEVIDALAHVRVVCIEGPVCVECYLNCAIQLGGASEEWSDQV